MNPVVDELLKLRERVDNLESHDNPVTVTADSVSLATATSSLTLGSAGASVVGSVSATGGLNLGSATVAGTGELIASGAVYTPALFVNNAAGTFRDFNFTTNGLRRWTFRTNSVTEADNEGSDFQFFSANDDGSPRSTIFTVQRNSGLFTLYRDMGISASLAIGATAASSNQRLRVIGTTTNSSAFCLIGANSAGTSLAYIRNDGYLWANQAWAIGSDERLKNQIRDLPTETARHRLVRYRQYERRNTGTAELGVVAQELREVYPDLVSEVIHPGATETELAVNYTGLSILQGKALQELAEQVEALATANVTLTARVESLEKRK